MCHLYDPSAPGRCVKLLAKEHPYKLLCPGGKPPKRKAAPEEAEEKEKSEQPKAKAKAAGKAKSQPKKKAKTDK